MKEISISKMARRIPRGERTRQQILETAVDLASAEGLEGLTIGRLAQALSMSKSGLFAHFGSKEELQIATIETARDIFVREIVDPASSLDRGITRLQAMLDKWLSYVERRVFKGGCFFAAAAAEFDGRPGAVRDLIAGLSKSWLKAIEEEVRHAQRIGQFSLGVDPVQMAFELHAMAQEANWSYHLLDDKLAFAHAREGVRRRLELAATRSALSMIQSSADSSRKKSRRKRSNSEKQ